MADNRLSLASQRKGHTAHARCDHAFNRDTLNVPMIVAVDTGGTKTLVAVFNTDGQIIAEQKFPTPKEVPLYIAELKSTIDSLVAGQSITCLSVALPGTIVHGILDTATNLGWQNIDIKTLLNSYYDCPIIVENDANLAGLAEARAIEPVPGVCLYVTVSTGIGTGIIVNGQIDKNFSTTEGGKIVLEHQGELKLWENFASGRALHEKYGKLASEIEDPLVWDEIASNVARGLLVHSPIVRPDIIVIGGGVGTHFEKFGARVNELLRANMKEKYVPLLTQAVHPEEAVIYGCYYYALDTAAA